MADKKISQLNPASTPLAGTEVLPIVQSGATVKASVANVQDAPYTAGTATGVLYLNGSKVASSSANLTTDGTNLVVGGATQSTTFEVGNVNDTTISRSAAGVIAVEGKPVVTTTGGQTVEFAAGAVGTPSVTTTGDTNTGIYFPSADTVAIAIGGAETARFNSSANFGVGTNNPGYKLTVNAGATNATTYTTAAFSGGSTVYIQQQQTTSVSTSATTILTPNLYVSLCLVHGSDGTNRFVDLIMCGLGTGTVNVISSLTASGTPAVRTYAQSGSTYKLTMASGTYTVQVYAMSLTS
jgi:hypothetical protein